MRRVFAVIIALVTGANGVAMLVDPAGWFTRVPGAVATGPFNSHFVLDVGIAFIVAGGAFAALAWRRRLRPAAMTGAAFLALHGALHLWEIAQGHRPRTLRIRTRRRARGGRRGCGVADEGGSGCLRGSAGGF